MGTSIDKHNRLSKVSSPKLVLVGGSNLQYGIDSSLLEERIGLPVVNMGIQASIGLRFMLAEVEESARPGDLFVVVAEHGLYFKPELIDGESSLYTLAAVRPPAFQFFTANQWFRMPRFFGTATGTNFSDVRRNIIKKLKGQNRFREDTTKYGDYIGHKGRSSTYEAKNLNRFHNLEVHPRVLNLLQSFGENVERLGATMIIS
ncbi:MAG: hypothetical protein ACI9R3_003267, partial [Verrucomicrobiales bacterium]